jgi:hypothetical protein
METLEELKIELAVSEKRLSRISQHPDMGKEVIACANKIAALREKIKRVEASSKGNAS